VTRTAPLVSLARIVAVAGLALWVLAAIYALPVALSGFVNWAAPNVYVSGLVLGLGLALNAVLLSKAAALRVPTAVGLMLASIALSAIVVGGVAFMAAGP
jgi:hypothetical protein